MGNVMSKLGQAEKPSKRGKRASRLHRIEAIVLHRTRDVGAFLMVSSPIVSKRGWSWLHWDRKPDLDLGSNPGLFSTPSSIMAMASSLQRRETHPTCSSPRQGGVVVVGADRVLAGTAMEKR